jgi:hypothetical protein
LYVNEKIGRGEWIRTTDLPFPNRERTVELVDDTLEYVAILPQRIGITRLSSL